MNLLLQKLSSTCTSNTPKTKVLKFLFKRAVLANGVLNKVLCGLLGQHHVRGSFNCSLLLLSRLHFVTI